MNFIHIADIHASKERLSQILHILETLKEKVRNVPTAFILFAGDFWDSTITATKGSGFSDIISAIRELEKYTKLFFIYGTASHEPSGSLDAFKSERTKVYSDFEVTPFFFNSEFVNLIFIPEPRRGNFISGSISKTDEAINNYLDFVISEAKKQTENSHSIVVYHGEVKGAMYQNGTYASSPTAITKEKLLSLNADYYAFGHIHLPQEVFCNAYYSGSACPKNFGESHDGSYNFVTIENGKTNVEKISFNLPTYQTIQIKNLKELESFSNFSNKNIRFLYECSKEDKKNLDIRTLSNELKERTNAVSIKFEITVNDEKKVKTSEVIQRKSLTEKLIEFSKEKGLNIPSHTIELMNDIKDNTFIKFAYPQHSFELISLSLRGAIGIRDGQHKEDFEIDFSKFDDGVVCLIGANGTGKTTIIENCHPYPCMLTRNDSLKENFYLKDSHRILVYKDEADTYYKISMLIDGKNSTGKVLYFAETSKDLNTWNCVPDTDGSLASYQKWVNSTFGSIDIFLRTAFFAKEQTKNTPDISSTTKSERMELLSKLAGTEHLKEVSSIAKEKRKELEIESDQLMTEINSYNKFEEIIENNNQDIFAWEEALNSQKDIIANLEKTVSKLNEKNSAFQKQKAVFQTNSLLKEKYTNELNLVKQEIENLNKGIKSVEIFNTANVYKKQNEKCLENIDKKQKEIADISAELLELTKRQSELNKKDLEISVTLKDYKIQTPDIKLTCPTCGASLSESKRKELENIVEYNKKRIKSLEEERKPVTTELKSLNERITDIQMKHLEIQDILNELNIEKQKCEDYFIEHQELLNLFPNFNLEELSMNLKLCTKEVTELQEKIDTIKQDESLEDVSLLLQETQSNLQREYEKTANLTANINAAKKENERYKNELCEKEQKKDSLDKIMKKITAYLFIENAFSNNGIPAIELRETAPEIADTANKILQNSFGNKFEIRFGSTSELKQKRKENEDFNIIVYDSENGDEKTIDLVSSGERIWIKQALFYAFSIVQMKRTGFNFRTRFIDESDGSLDSGLRPKYLQMVTAAHKNADARITMLITHSQEIKDIAQQVIEI